MVTIKTQEEKNDGKIDRINKFVSNLSQLILLSKYFLVSFLRMVVSFLRKNLTN